ncbi:hypothetical protein [Pseudomonas sp. PDM25]|uniref:hypothetical protein n=1 Tax=Pseudomonas sp. PDM25 TaxID=2854772 RepID=UPI001C495179|nr:hypothetical protein [Pseudomonas sp. PDM25]MBV7515046.1 hypothetical protein [Pseudomonas sp. PDM25]
MFIYLDHSILNCIAAEKIPHDTLRSIEGLSLILRSGAHLISGDQKTLIAISNLNDLSLPCRAIFHRAATRRSQVLSILKDVTTYTIVDFGRSNIECAIENNKKVIKIPIDSFIKLNFQSSSEVVFEDINDNLIYTAVAEWYAKNVLNNKYLSLTYKKVQGGGNRTYAVYKEKQQEGETFCLCITDSDKKYPTDTAGDTSALVREVEDTSMPLSYHLDLDFHEIENLLPLNFLEENSGTAEAKQIISTLKIAETNGYPEAKLYWDYKKGLRGHYAQENEHYRNYWHGALGVEYNKCASQCTAKKCECYLIRPWPLKAEVKTALASNHQISPDCEKLKNLWSEIASVFISWVIGAPPQKT